MDQKQFEELKELIHTNFIVGCCLGFLFMIGLVIITVLDGCASSAHADELNPVGIPLPYEVSKSLSYGESPAYDPNEPATITVLIVYTEAAEAWAKEYFDDVDRLIDEAMDYSNETALNSQVGIEFDVIEKLKTNYIESGNAVTDLKRLTNPTDNYMDEVHEVRDDIGADLVMLLADVNDVGGVAWVMKDPAGNSSYGFSLVRVKQAMNSTPVHEMGHNIGMGHHKRQNSQPGPGVFSYSAGGRWVGNDGVGYCSVMTYTGGSYYSDGKSHGRIPIFSNPRVLYEGVPTGDVRDADNARTAMEMKHVIAAYRYEPGRLQVDIEPSEAKWRVIDTQVWYDSGQEQKLPVGPTEIEFSDVRGWMMPEPVTVQIDENKLKRLSVTYEIETCIVLVAPTTGGQLIPSKQIVEYGQTATFQVRPDNGYTIGSVTGCGGSLSGSTYTTGIIESDCTIEARFDQIPKPPTVPSSDSGGGGGGGCFISNMRKN